MATTAKLKYSPMDMLDQAIGLPTPEGFAVITRQFARDLRQELERLYEIEEWVQTMGAATAASGNNDDLPPRMKG
jgi:hypothetical protein